MDTKALANATIAGTVLQLVMVVSGHFVPFIALHVFMWGGMGISALAGFLYGRGVAGDLAAPQSAARLRAGFAR